MELRLQGARTTLIKEACYAFNFKMTTVLKKYRGKKTNHSMKSRSVEKAPEVRDTWLVILNIRD